MELKNFIVKLKYKDGYQIQYSNEHLIYTKDEWKLAVSKYKNDSLLTQKAANKLMVTLIKRDKEYSDPDHSLEFISVVEVSNYKPYSDYQVVSYREFK